MNICLQSHLFVFCSMHLLFRWFQENLFCAKKRPRKLATLRFQFQWKCNHSLNMHDWTHLKTRPRGKMGKRKSMESGYCANKTAVQTRPTVRDVLVTQRKFIATMPQRSVHAFHSICLMMRAVRADWKLSAKVSSQLGFCVNIFCIICGNLIVFATVDFQELRFTHGRQFVSMMAFCFNMCIYCV